MEHLHGNYVRQHGWDFVLLECSNPGDQELYLPVLQCRAHSRIDVRLMNKLRHLDPKTTENLVKRMGLSNYERL